MTGIEKVFATNCRIICGTAALLLTMPAIARQPRAALDETSAHLENVDCAVPSHKLGPLHSLNPWFRADYSFGSGDSNSTYSTHGTLFQVLPTPRPYARFAFYNMMNNEDSYGTSMFRLPRSLVVRSELHVLRLASAQDPWYGGGGTFQPKTFGYTGRTSGGNRSLANVWDVSLDVALRYGLSVTT